MKINPQIALVLGQFNIPVDDGISYLLSVYFELKPTVFPPLLIQKINVTNIISMDNERNLMWNVPLFENSDPAASHKWDWVEEWREMFGRINPARKGTKSSTLIRMKTFFSQNPDVRKEEVIGATMLYFKSLQSADYLITSHYFIFKDKGTNKTSSLEEWIEKYRALSIKTNNNPGTNDITSRMQ